MITFPFPTVDGLLSDHDKDDLRAMAAACSTLRGWYVEIGSMHGLSTLCICSGMPDYKKLFAYDVNHNVNKIHNNVTEAGFNDRVLLVHGDFKETMPHFLEGAVAFAFVDHDHTFENTVVAYALLWPALVPGGIVAFHDYGHPDYPEPTPFLNALPHKRYPTTGGCIAFIK